MTRSWSTLAIAASMFALLLLPVIPGLGTRGNLGVANLIMIAVVFSLSYNVLLGQAGLLSFGHALYFGAGAYCGIFAMKWGVISVPFIPVAGAACALMVGMTLGGLAALRSGAVFAMITLGLGELVGAVAIMLPSVFGGEEGVVADRTATPDFLGVGFGSPESVYYLVVCWTLISSAALAFVVRTPLGRIFNAMRDNSERVAFFGYKVRMVRFCAILFAGAFAGVAGSLFAVVYETVSGEAFSLNRSGMVVIMVCLGGAGYFWGPVIGAVLVTLLHSSLSGLSNAWMFYLGLFFVYVVLFLPGGVAAMIERQLRLLRRFGVPRYGAGVAAMIPGVALTLAGVIGLVEMGSRASGFDNLGTPLMLFGLGPIDATSVTNWIIAWALLAGGVLVSRRIWARSLVADRVNRPGFTGE